MGCFYEINDTLLLTKDQGFPSDVLDIEKHQKKPITLADVKGKLFSFRNKPAARAFQLDPVRVYLFENTKNDKWLGWGRAFIQSLTIERKKGLAPSDPAGPISFNAGRRCRGGDDVPFLHLLTVFGLTPSSLATSFCFSNSQARCTSVTTVSVVLPLSMPTTPWEN